MLAARTAAGFTGCMQHSSGMVDGVAQTVQGLGASANREPVTKGTLAGRGQSTHLLPERTVVVAEGGWGLGASISSGPDLKGAGAKVC